MHQFIMFSMGMGLALAQTAMAGDIEIECRPFSLDQSQSNCTIKSDGLSVVIAGVGTPDASLIFETIDSTKYIAKFQMDSQCILIRDQKTMKLIFLSPRTGKKFALATECKGA